MLTLLFFIKGKSFSSIFLPHLFFMKYTVNAPSLLQKIQGSRSSAFKRMLIEQGYKILIDENIADTNMITQIRIDNLGR